MGIGQVLLALVLLAAPAAAQEALSLAPGHTLRFHPSSGPDRPVSGRYELALDAGDWLVVVAPAALIDGAATQPPIVLTGPQGQQVRKFGRLVARIDTAGTWRIALTGMHALSIARYSAGHPVVDPGVAPTAVRLAPGALGTPRIAVEPFDPRYDDVPPPSGTPARLVVTAGALTIDLYRRAALRQTELWAQDPTGLVARLLDSDAPIEPGLYLPYYPISEGFTDYVARSERLRGACFTFLRYLAHHTQETVHPFDRLTYRALGLSADGAWFAVATADAELPRAKGDPTAPQDGRSPDYEAALTRRLADGAAISPGLAALDAAVASLCLP